MNQESIVYWSGSMIATARSNLKISVYKMDRGVCDRVPGIFKHKF